MSIPKSVGRKNQLQKKQRQTLKQSTSGDSNFGTECWPLGWWFCLLLKAEPILFNPYTLYPPSKGPANPKGPGRLCSLLLTPGLGKVTHQGQMSKGTTVSGTALRLEREKGQIRTF